MHLCVVARKHMLIRFFILIGFSALSQVTMGDTIDYWHVYHNDSVIGKYHQGLTPSITIKRSTLKEGDTLTIIHRDDTPCSECNYHLIARDERGRRLLTTTTNKHWGKLSFQLSDLMEACERLECKQYQFYHAEQGHTKGPMMTTLILQMTID